MGLNRLESDHGQFELGLEVEEPKKTDQEVYWEEMLNGNTQYAEKIDKKYNRLVSALLESRKIPLKEVLDDTEIETASEDLRVHGDYVDGEGEVHLEIIPKLVLGEEVTKLTDDEVRFLAKFRGVVAMNFVKDLSLSQAEELVNLKAPLFVKGLEPEKDSFISTQSQSLDPLTHKAIEITHQTLPEELNKVLAKRDYYTGVAWNLQIALHLEREKIVWGGHTVDIEKPA